MSLHFSEVHSKISQCFLSFLVYFLENVVSFDMCLYSFPSKEHKMIHFHAFCWWLSALFTNSLRKQWLRKLVEGGVFTLTESKILQKHVKFIIGLYSSSRLRLRRGIALVFWKVKIKRLLACVYNCLSHRKNQMNP